MADYLIDSIADYLVDLMARCDNPNVHIEYYMDAWGVSVHLWERWSQRCKSKIILSINKNVTKTIDANT